jgi:excisionase family DNA binding protein
MAATPTGPASAPRFLQLTDVAEVLNTSSAQVYSLVRSGELPAIKIGGRGQWRVEASELERYIERMYEQTRDFVSTHRFGRADEESGADAGG